MKTNQHAAEQIIRILEQAGKGEQTIAALCREHGIAENTFYRWRTAYGGMSVNSLFS
jgi:putative transposase